MLALALVLPNPARAGNEPSRAALRDLSVQESSPKRTGLEEAFHLQPAPASGLEKLHLAEEKEWLGTRGQVLGRIREITRRTEAGGAELVGRVVYTDPERVRLSSHWNPEIDRGDFPRWQDPPVPLDKEEKNRLDNTGMKPDQWRRMLAGSGKDPLVLLTDSLQPDFHQPYGFLIVDGKVIRQKYASEKYSLDAAFLRGKGYDDTLCAFVLEPGPPRVTALRFQGEQPVEELTGMTLQEGRPVGSGAVRNPILAHVISGIPLLLNGEDVSGQVRSNRLPQPREIRPNEVVWPTDRRAAFSAIGTNRGGPPILLSVTAHVDLHQLADLMRQAGMTDGILRQGSGGVLQWLAAEGYPPLHGVPDAGSERTAEQEVRSFNAVLAGRERSAGPPSAGLEEGIDEPHLKVDDPYGKALRALVEDPHVTPESVKRRTVLREIGPELEEHARRVLSSPDVRIAIVPLGSALRGYAAEGSDLDYSILILMSEGSLANLTDGAADQIVRRSMELIGERGFRANGGVEAADIPAMIREGPSSSEDAVLTNEWLAELFLPVAYGDAQAVERTRQAAMTFLQGPTQCSWRGVSYHHRRFVDIDPDDVPLSAHLRDWLSRQAVAAESAQAVRAFNRGRGVRLPHQRPMLRIYPVSPAGLEEQGTVTLPGDEGTLAFTRFRPASPGTHPVALVLHAYGFSRKDAPLRAIGQRLAREGFEAVLPDFRNHRTRRNGNESSGSWKNFSFKANIQDVAFLVQHLAKESPEADLRRTVLVGYSYGGLVARRVAALAHGGDARFAGLGVRAVVDLAGGVDPQGSFLMYWDRILEKDQNGNQALMNLVDPQRVFSPLERAERAMAEWKKAGFVELAGERVRYWLPELDGYSALDDLVPLPSGLPYLYVVGDKDFIIAGKYKPFPTATAFQDAVAQRGLPSRLLILPDVGHFLLGKDMPDPVFAQLMEEVAAYLTAQVPAAGLGEGSSAFAREIEVFRREQHGRFQHFYGAMWEQYKTVEHRDRVADRGEVQQWISHQERTRPDVVLMLSIGAFLYDEDGLAQALEWARQGEQVKAAERLERFLRSLRGLTEGEGGRRLLSRVPAKQVFALRRWLDEMDQKGQALRVRLFSSSPAGLEERYDPMEVADRLVRVLLEQSRFGEVVLSLGEAAKTLGNAPTERTLSSNLVLLKGINTALVEKTKDTALTQVRVERGKRGRPGYNPAEVADRLIRALLDQDRSGEVALSLSEAARVLGDAPTQTAFSHNPALVDEINTALAEKTKDTALTQVRIEKDKVHLIYVYDPAEVADRLIRALRDQHQSGEVVLSLYEAAKVLGDAPTKPTFSQNPALVGKINAALAEKTKGSALMQVRIEKGKAPLAYDPAGVADRLVRALLDQHRSGEVALSLSGAARMLKNAPTKQALSLSPALVDRINEALVEKTKDTALTQVRIEKGKTGKPPQNQLAAGMEEWTPQERRFMDDWTLLLAQVERRLSQRQPLGSAIKERVRDAYAEALGWIHRKDASASFKSQVTDLLATLVVIAVENGVFPPEEVPGVLERTIERLTALMAQEPGAEAARRGMRHFHLASLYFNRKDFPAFLEHWAIATRLMPRDWIEVSLKPAFALVNQEVARRSPLASSDEQKVQLSAEAWVEMILRSKASHRVLDYFFAASQGPALRYLCLPVHRVVQDPNDPLYAPLVELFRDAMGETGSPFLDGALASANTPEIRAALARAVSEAGQGRPDLSAPLQQRLAQLQSAGLEEGRFAVERITPEVFRRRFPQARWWDGARGVYLASQKAVSNIRLYAGHDTLWDQLQEWLKGERTKLPDGMEAHLLRLPADASGLRAPGVVIKDWMLTLPYGQQILPELEAAVGEPLPSLASMILFALKGAGGQVEAVIGVMKLEDAQGRAVYAYFV